MSHLGFRDAIHVPYIMVKCHEEDVRPGTKMSLRHNHECVVWGFKPEDEEPIWHGVADPFRETDIPKGELFPVYIRKECFGGMRHDFTIEVHDRGGTDTCHSVCDIF